MTIARRDWIKQVGTLAAGATLLTGFHPVLTEGEDPIYLNANENPYGPSDLARKAILRHLDQTNRYPSKQDAVDRLLESLATRLKASKDQLVLGAGSSEVLQLIAHWVLNRRLDLSYFSPTFPILPNFIHQFGGKVTELPMGDNFVCDLSKLDIERPNQVYYLVNPNNPTGISIPTDQLRSFLVSIPNSSYVVLDEAYIEYQKDQAPMLDLVWSRSNLILVRTFSKIYGLAGLRVGYALASSDLAKELRTLQIWSSNALNLLGLEAANASLNDAAFIRQSRQRNTEVRGWTLRALQEAGFKVYPSDTNFLFFKTGQPSLDKRLLKHGIHTTRTITIRDNQYIRLTVGTKNEMQRFIQQLNRL